MLPGLSSRALLGTSDRPRQCFLPAKVSIYEQKTKEKANFFIVKMANNSEKRGSKRKNGALTARNGHYERIA